VPVKLVSQQTVGPTLGKVSLDMSIRAALIGFVLVALFMILAYRLPGILSVVALVLYAFLNLVAYKLFGVTVTLSSIAGFVLSLGIAVDANVLIFERVKEELRKGKMVTDALKEGFARAWPSIRDSNTSSIITAVILYYFAATPVVRGFALVFCIGVIVSMFTAITASRMFLYALGTRSTGSAARFLFGSGLSS